MRHYILLISCMKKRWPLVLAIIILVLAIVRMTSTCSQFEKFRSANSHWSAGQLPPNTPCFGPLCFYPENNLDRVEA